MDGLHILVADDDPDVARSLGRVLETRGHEVELAYSGHAAVESFRQRSFDIAFMDLRMPDKDGLRCLREIREFRLGARIVIMSGYIYDPELGQAVDQGAWGVVQAAGSVESNGHRSPDHAGGLLTGHGGPRFTEEVPDENRMRARTACGGGEQGDAAADPARRR
jgi:CheY-like chemotaxis protein